MWSKSNLDWEFGKREIGLNLKIEEVSGDASWETLKAIA